MGVHYILRLFLSDAQRSRFSTIGKSGKKSGKSGKNIETGFSLGKLSNFIELKFQKKQFLAFFMYFWVIPIRKSVSNIQMLCSSTKVVKNVVRIYSIDNHFFNHFSKSG